MQYKDIKKFVEELFVVLECILKLSSVKSTRGRKREDYFKILLTIVFVNKTGMQWRMVPPSPDLVKGSTAYSYYLLWTKDHTFDKLHAACSKIYNDIIGYKTTWQSVDCTKVQAPVRANKLGNECTGANPTDRGFSGTKISIMTDQIGMILGFTLSGANVHDMKLLDKTLVEGSLLSLYSEDERKKMHLCLDKGYYGEPAEICAFLHGFEPHIQSRGEEIKEKQKGKKPRRWVVERAIAWLKGFHHIRTRYTKYSNNFKSLIEIAVSMMLMRRVTGSCSIDRVRGVLATTDWTALFNWQEEQRQAA